MINCTLLSNEYKFMGGNTTGLSFQPNLFIHKCVCVCV